MTTMKQKIQFPEDAMARCSAEGINVVRSLLDRNPSHRLGCRPNGQGVIDIREHPWFASLDWENLEVKEMQPPFVPDMKKANFDVTHELDEFLMVEKPLTHSKRKVNPDFEKMKPEIREMEEQFTVYDFNSSKRKSYYPHNLPIVSAAHNLERDELGHVQSQTNTSILTATVGERSLAESPPPDTNHHNMPPLPLPVFRRSN